MCGSRHWGVISRSRQCTIAQATRRELESSFGNETFVRDDFTKRTIDTLAKRAGYVCSNPGCRCLTVGAARGNEGFVIVGVAAHITAASSGGPRYDPALTQEQRRHSQTASGSVKHMASKLTPTISISPLRCCVNGNRRQRTGRFVPSLHLARLPTSGLCLRRPILRIVN